jgi:hypothetical protein
MCSEMAMPGGWTMSMMWMRMHGQTWIGSATAHPVERPVCANAKSVAAAAK